MFSRRHFLWLSSLAAGASAVPASAAQRPQGEGAGDGALPPSIAGLTSMKSQAKPITTEERQARIERARALMVQSKIDAILLAGGTSLDYFTGMRWGNSERLFAVVIPAKGNPFAVGPAFEEERARELLVSGPLAKTDVITWQEDESPFERVALGLKAVGISTGRLGIEETVKFVFADSVAAAAPGITLTSASPVTAGCRMVKTAHELALMKLANQVTLKAYEAAYKALQPGMTQNHVSSLVSQAHSRLGFTGHAGPQVGEYSALPHGSIQPQVIKEGTIVMMDGGCTVEGYQSDITRTFVLGKATDKMKRVFDLVHKAQSAALAAAKPGVSLASVDAAARKVIVDGGFGPGFKYFTHRVGHGIGMDGHEWPYLVNNNMFGWERTPPLAAGMAFSDEPGIYIRGEFGVRLEDDMFITENGAELFTPQSPSIEQPY